MEKTRVAIIGTGNISNAHMEGYNSMPDTVELAACCDIDRDKAEAYAKRYGFPKVYTDYNEMLAEVKPDAVSVCTWNAEHKNAAIAALQAGANVICEKPMAMNRFEAEEMKKAADEAGKVLMIGFAGRPKPVSAFGVTYNNLGCDRASSEKGWVSSSKGRDFKYDVEDFASALIRFDSGLTLQIEASFNLNIRSDTGSIELFGTKAGAKLDPDVELFTDMSGHFVNVKPYGSASRISANSFVNEIRHFIDCVRNGTPCLSPAEDGVELMKMIDAIYESAKTGRAVEIQ